MKIREKIEETIKKSAELEKEHAAILTILKKKKSEVEGLAAGIDKYKNDHKLSESMKKILLQKYEELKEIKVKADDLEARFKEVKVQMKKLYSLVNKHKRETAVKIAVSPAAEKALEQALSAIPQEEKVTAPKVVEKVLKEEKKEPQKEAQVKVTPKAAAPQKDLYEQAAAEAKAQEEFLKSQSRRSYGNI